MMLVHNYPLIKLRFRKESENKRTKKTIGE